MPAAVRGQGVVVRFGNMEIRPAGGGAGCLGMILVSILASVVLTVVLNVILRLF